MANILEVNCPTCSTLVKWTETALHRPFCSERCKQIDLGAWADESYSIPVATQDEWSLQESISELEAQLINKQKNSTH